jgi:two-component system, cell cycle sensor histidine kinase and response regulator CckA
MTHTKVPKIRPPVLSEQQLRHAFEAAQLAAWEIHLPSNSITCSPSTRELWGIDRGTPDQFRARIHPEDRPRVEEVKSEALAGITTLRLECRVLGPDGTYHWIHSRGEIIAGPDGKPERLVGVSGNIDHRKQAEAALREHDERLRMALRAAAAGTWDLDSTTHLATWSEDCFLLHGSAASGKPIRYEEWMALVHPDDRARTDAAIRQGLEQGGDITLEYRVSNPQRGKRWLVAIGRAIPGGPGAATRVSGIALDITERKQVEERLRQSAKMEAIGQLAGGLAHDFNNQLHALSGLIDFVARDPGLSEASTNDLIEIQNTSDRMASLTRQLLAFSRQQVLIPETIEINTAVMETKPMLQRLVGSSLEMQLELSSDANWVKVDRTQLLQVLMNLVINARDAMPGGGKLSVRTGTRVVRGRELDTVARGPVLPGNYAELEVQDSGTGIAREDMVRIFEPFFTTKPAGEGTGLGLATVDGILNQSRGHIWAESQEGTGATFHVLLPLTVPPLETAPPVARMPRRSGSPARLLVVDDETMVREVIVRTLVNHGYEVFEAANGEEALNRIRTLEGKLDLVVSDVVMPVMGGAELAHRLAELYPSLPIVWMSGYPRETVIGRGRLGEDQPFLQKPVPPALLLDTVARSVTTK